MTFRFISLSPTLKASFARQRGEKGEIYDGEGKRKIEEEEKRKIKERLVMAKGRRERDTVNHGEGKRGGEEKERHVMVKGRGEGRRKRDM